MKFTAVLSSQAVRDIEEIVTGLSDRSPAAAVRLHDDFYKAIDALQHFPLGCPILQDVEQFPFPFRYTLVGPYKVIFAVHGDVVKVAHVRDGRRRPPARADLLN